MIDTKELRRLAQAAHFGHMPLEISGSEVLDLLDRLEAAEQTAQDYLRIDGEKAQIAQKLEAAERERDDVAQQLVQSEQGKRKISEECDALRSKIEQMERQEPVAKVRVHRTGGNAGIAWSVAPLNDFDSLPLMRDGSKLYALPGTQNATKAVAYLDLGVGGYMDVGTDLTDEELAALPKGRHMLGVIGTYGVDGYVPAQPAPSVPDGWLRAIDEALVITHLGVADKSDTYEQAREKLNNLICWHVDVATDPAVNGGFRLIPINPTQEMLDAGEDTFSSTYTGTPTSTPIDVYNAMLAAAPEDKK